MHATELQQTAPCLMILCAAPFYAAGKGAAAAGQRKLQSMGLSWMVVQATRTKSEEVVAVWGASGSGGCRSLVGTLSSQQGV